jgi:hypothetical protein
MVRQPFFTLKNRPLHRYDFFHVQGLSMQNEIT